MRPASVSPNAPGVLLLYTASVFTSALLLFLVEPMVAKSLLPLVGGAPAVWTTSLLFFQAMLLAGYGYSHLVATRLGPRLQALLQTGVLHLAVLSLPIQFAGVGSPAPGSNPLGWQLAVMLTRVGLPFFCLSTLSPLLQSWFSRSQHARAGDPYFLYLASNLGSLGALVVYPALVERYLGLAIQERVWMVGYLLLVVLIGLTTVQLWRAAGRSAAPTEPGSWPHHRVPLRRFLLWVALAAVPSLWMLAVTEYFTTRIRPIPLLWVIPLALYLLSFALVFAPRPVLLLRWSPAYPFVAIPVLALTLLGGDSLPFLYAAVVHFSAFLLAALLCHGRLAADRPAASGLTLFYLALAVGGAFGGLVGAILAPRVLPDLYEYPLALIAGGLLLPTLVRAAPRRRGSVVAIAVGVPALVFGAAFAAIFTGLPAHLSAAHVTNSASLADLLRLGLAVPLPAIGAVAISRRPAGLALMLATILGVSLLPLGSEPAPLYQSRDFFGVHKVTATSDGSWHVYRNGGVIHGIQNEDPSIKDEPTGYYAPTGPVGDVFNMWASDTTSVAIVGLGAGDMACFRRRAQAWTYYEIDAEVIKIATDPALFTYLRDCTPESRLVLGDGRLKLARAPDRSYGVIAIDAFSGDAPPLHLLTREAIGMYLTKLRPGGLLLFNISNSYVDFSAVLGATGRSLGLRAYERVDGNLTARDQARGKLASDWLVLARSESDAASAQSWSDVYSDILSVMRRFLRSWALRGR